MGWYKRRCKFDVSSHLRRRREAAGIKRSELAQCVCYQPAAICNWEAGRLCVDQQTLMQLEDIFGKLSAARPKLQRDMLIANLSELCASLSDDDVWSLIDRARYLRLTSEEGNNE